MRGHVFRGRLFILGFCLGDDFLLAAGVLVIAAETGAWGLDLLGVPVLLDGNVIQLSRVTLGVTEACSGIRSLISLLALAVAWSYLALSRPRARALLIVSAVPITIVA